MNEISNTEKDIIIKFKIFSNFFNKEGYILDFSNYSFAQFCLKSIGIDLKSKYNLSKFKSFTSFIESDEFNLQIKYKFCLDLLEYSKGLGKINIYTSFINEDQLSYLDLILKEIKYLIDSYNSGFEIKKIEAKSWKNRLYLLENSIKINDTENSLGICKELVESLFITIIKSKNIEFNEKRENYQLLIKKGFANFEFISTESNSIKKWFNSIKNILLDLGELRNKYGTGHGKDLNDSIHMNKDLCELVIKTTIPLINYLIIFYKL